MRPELARLQFIESQLLTGALPAAEWRQHLLLDPELAADTGLQARLYQQLQAAGRQELHRELTAIHRRLHGRRPPWWTRAANWLTAWRAAG